LVCFPQRVSRHASSWEFLAGIRLLVAQSKQSKERGYLIVNDLRNESEDVVILSIAGRPILSLVLLDQRDGHNTV